MHVRQMSQAFEVRTVQMSNGLYFAFTFTFRFPYGGGRNVLEWSIYNLFMRKAGGFFYRTRLTEAMREASRIIANRPYLTKTELVSKNVLPVGPFLSVRHLVVAMPKTAPKGKS